MREFLAMGGYAAYVWASYALSAAVIGGLALTSFRRLKALESALAELETGDER
ncbi:MAG: heme exporter protein CcmD [Tagaea sp.]